MSHAVTIPDDLYQRLTSLATTQGLPVDRVVADMLARELEASHESAPSSSAVLDWQTASAEDIIASVRASRIERSQPVEL